MIPRGPIIEKTMFEEDLSGNTGMRGVCGLYNVKAALIFRNMPASVWEAGLVRGKKII